MTTATAIIKSAAVTAGLAALLGFAAFAQQAAVAATATESGFGVPGSVHRGNGVPLQAANAAGMPATVADFLATQGRSAATVNSIHVLREMAAGNTGATVLDLGQEVQGLAVYGVRARAIFDPEGNLQTISENLVPVGRVLPAAIDAHAALDAAMKKVHPDVSVTLVEHERVGNRVSFSGGDFFYRDPTVTRVAVPAPGGALQVGFLVETWTDQTNQLHHTLVSGHGEVLEDQLRTNDDSYNVFTVDPGKTAQSPVDGPGSGNPESPSGWLSGSQKTIDITGNNVHAYLDTDANNRADPGGATVSDDNFGTAADLNVSPSVSQNQEVAVQNLFYLNNKMHDELYRHGFDEAAGNFQEDNFGNGGSGSDSVNAEAQDGSGLDNANFSTPSDGSNPRMQMYLWNNIRVSVGSDSYPAGGADFGPSLDSTGVEGAVVEIGNQGCSASDFSTADPEEVALIDRGGCAFALKVQYAGEAGYIAAIIVNGEDVIMTMGHDPSISYNVTIPSALISSSAGAAIRGQLPAIGSLSNNPKDGDLDSDIVYHEYSHGLTWRMVGNMTGVMGGALGEGMSDVVAIVINDDPTVGEYSYSNPNGIRTAPYDTYLADTNRTYEDFVGEVHADGEIYAATIWDVWNRYRSDTTLFPSGHDEARDALLDDLVAGLSQTGYQCSRPTFQTMRDGILQAVGGTADPNGSPTNLQKWCYVWQGFAKYGIGVNQTTQCTISGFGPFQTITWNWTNGFDIPAQCEGPIDSPPTVSLTNPGNGATVSGSVSVTANAGDDNGVTQVEFFVDGTSIGVDTNGGDGWSVSWDTTQETEATHTITATASDTATPPQMTSDTVSVTVDNYASPTATITAPTGGTVTGSVAVSADVAVATGLSVGQVEFFSDGTSIGVDTNGGDGWSVSWDTTAASNGSHDLTAVVTDSKQQTATSGAVTVTVSNSGPATMHIGDLDNVSTPGSRRWTAAVRITVHDDNHAPVANATVSGSWSGSANGGGSCTTDGSGLCEVSKGAKNGGAAFTVTGVSHASLTYNAADNHDPDGDSNGTVIALPQP